MQNLCGEKLKHKFNTSLISFIGICVFCLFLFSSVFVFSSVGISYAEEKTGMQFVLPNMIEFIPMLIAFIVVAIVLYKFGWPKFEAILDERKSTIEGALKESEEKRIEAEKLLESYKKQLADANAKADKIINDAKLDGAKLSSKLEAEGKEKADMQLSKAKLSINQSKKKAESEIKEQAIDIATAALVKLVSNDLTTDQHKELIKKYILEAGSLEGSNER